MSAGARPTNRYPDDARHLRKQYFASDEQLVTMIMGGEIYLPGFEKAWALGSAGNGSIQHIAGELFKQHIAGELFKLTGASIAHVPYRGAGPAVQDLVGNQVDVFITTPASVIGHIQGGRLKALAVTGKERLSALPNVPTAEEAGLKGFELDSWFALYAPAGMPAPIIEQLNAAVGKILDMPEVKKKAEDAGTATEKMTPQQLGEYTAKELADWGKVIKSAKITAD